MNKSIASKKTLEKMEEKRTAGVRPYDSFERLFKNEEHSGIKGVQQSSRLSGFCCRDYDLIL